MSLPPPGRRHPKWGAALGRRGLAEEASVPDSGPQDSAPQDSGPQDSAMMDAAASDFGQPERQQTTAASRAPRGLPGGRVVTVATLIVIAVAALEVWSLERIGIWTGITLVVVSVIAAVVTRAGDRSLPIMMPPLAFLAAILTAGQALLPGNSTSIWAREAVLIAETLGSNAAWVVAATVLAAAIVVIRRLR